MTPEDIYTQADRAVHHYQRLLAGDGLTRADKRRFRILLLRACDARWRAREEIAQTDQVAA